MSGWWYRLDETRPGQWDRVGSVPIGRNCSKYPATGWADHNSGETSGEPDRAAPDRCHQIRKA